MRHGNAGSGKLSPDDSLPSVTPGLYVTLRTVVRVAAQTALVLLPLLGLLVGISLFFHWLG